MTEVMPEDKPGRDVIADDRKFDAWLEDLERQSKKRVAKSKQLRLKADMELGSGAD